MSALEIPQKIFSEMLAQARSQAPIESCGILGGRDHRVLDLYKMTNSDQSSDHFTMAPEEQFAVAKEMRGKDQEMLAIYHSHPASPARPSAEDIRLAFTPGVIYVIVSLQEPANPQIRGFTIYGDVVAESAVKIVEEN